MQSFSKHTLPGLIRLFGRESQAMLSTTLLLLLDADEIDLDGDVCFAAEAGFADELLVVVFASF